MSRRIQLALLVVGAALFSLIVVRIGPARVLDNAEAVGWLFIPILLLYGVAYAANTAAWRLTMGDGHRPGFWRTYVITVSGFSLNFVTPVINAGGEPFRIAALARWLGPRRAASSVVLHKMLHSLALLLVWLTALCLALALLPRTRAVVGPLVGALAIVSALAALVLSGHERGGLERILDLLHRTPLLTGVARRLEPKRIRFVHPYVDARASSVLVEARKGGGVELAVEAPFIMYEAPGVYTAEARAWLERP